MAVIAMDVSIIISLCFIGLRHTMVEISLHCILLCAGIGLHGHGKWLQHKHDFKGKTFTQVFLRKDFILHIVKITKSILDVQKLKNALNTFSTLKMRFLDFAGDEEYYAYHQIFLNSDAFYVIVFNIQEYIQDEFRDIDIKIKRLLFWLKTIYSYTRHGKPPVFLVGTHAGNTNRETLRELDKFLRKSAVWQLFIDEFILNEQDDLIFYPVENSRELADNGILALRAKIKSVAEDEFKDVIGQEIPFSWIKMQDALIQCSQDPLEPVCLTVEDFKKHFEHLYVEWDDEMLRYFHKKGFIIHVDKDEKISKWVLLKPNVLVQIIILLINPLKMMKNKRGTRKHWLHLEKEGMITETLKQEVLSRVGERKVSVVMAFLEEYDLVCPLKYQPEEAVQCCTQQTSYQGITAELTRHSTHFVPTLLPMKPSRSMWDKSVADKESTRKFYISFDNFFPQSLFHRLLSRACKLAADAKKSYKPIVYRDEGTFWLSPDQPYCISLMKDEDQIEVTFSTGQEGAWKPFDIISTVAVSMVESICKRDFPNVSFHCGPECTSPSCPGSVDVSGQRRRHVVNLFPAYKTDPRSISFGCLGCDRNEGTYWLSQ